jgi:hypothetical protein
MGGWQVADIWSLWNSGLPSNSRLARLQHWGKNLLQGDAQMLALPGYGANECHLVT